MEDAMKMDKGVDEKALANDWHDMSGNAQSYDLNNHASDVMSKAKLSKTESNTGQTDDGWGERSNLNERSYNDYYSNYYQHCGVKPDYPEAEGMKGVKPDEDVEEGQIPASPKPMTKQYSSPSTPSKPSSSAGGSHNSQYSRSMSRSISKERIMRSRSRSRRRYMSRSRSRSASRQRRRRSRSRSPYLGPIIKDYRRGRRGFVRYPRGFRDRGMRPFRRGHHSHHYINYGFSRRQGFSRSKSRSFSPKKRQIDSEKSDNSEDEKTMDSKRSDTQKPSDINLSQKRITQSFLAMLEEKQSKSKMVPIESNRSFEISEADENFNKQHGFVNTFNSVREMDSRKHTLSYDLEREGWQVIDDANSESAPKRQKIEKYKSLDREQSGIREKDMDGIPVEGSSSSDEVSKRKKKKTKKRKKKKKKKKASSSSDTSDSDSDNEDIEDINKKKSKKKKKLKKKKKSVTTSSSSENEDKGEKVKKKKKKKKLKESSTESEIEDKLEDSVGLKSIQKSVTESSDKIGSTSSLTNEIIKEETKEKKKKKKKADSSESSESDSDKNDKKKKKKNKKKKSKKRKHRSSSSSSTSESSDSSGSRDRKKKKKKKSKKNKKSKKHKKEKKERKERNRLSADEKKKPKSQVEEPKQSEFVTVLSVGDPPLELKWPTKLIKFTVCEPPLQYSCNPKVTINDDDFRNAREERNKIIDEIQRRRKYLAEFGSDSERDGNVMNKDNSDEKLMSEYEKFMDELNPSKLDLEVGSDPTTVEMRMREKLLKQFNSVKSDSSVPMTPSEKRAIERMKRYQYSNDETDVSKRQSDLKSEPLSTYYSAKKHSKTNSYNKDDQEIENKIISEVKSSESEPFHRTNDISINLVEKTGQESKIHDNSSKSDEKKRTARELLERVKQKRHSGKESEGKDDSHHSTRHPLIGKMKKSDKDKGAKTSAITTANADSTQNCYVSKPMKLDMNYDYNWYYNYYMNSYAYGQYTDPNNLMAAYYAQYNMVTSYDYKQTDFANWMQQKGYVLDTNTNTYVESNEQIINENIDTTKAEPSVESSVSEVNPSNLDSDGVEQKIELNDSEKVNINENEVKTIENESLPQNCGNIKVKTNDDMFIAPQKIETIVHSSHSSLNLISSLETKEETELSPNTSPFSSANFKHKVKVRVTTSHQNENESEDYGSPLPPPPLRPQMTEFTSTEPITLPNGQVLPAGTKQIVVHPYHSDDSLKYSADWFQSAYNSQNSTKTSNINCET